jgi:hypothetical protein
VSWRPRGKNCSESVLTFPQSSLVFAQSFPTFLHFSSKFAHFPPKNSTLFLKNHLACFAYFPHLRRSKLDSALSVFLTYPSPVFAHRAGQIKKAAKSRRKLQKVHIFLPNYGDFC